MTRSVKNTTMRAFGVGKRVGHDSTGLAAQCNGRFYVGYETNETYLNIAQNRLWEKFGDELL